MAIPYLLLALLLGAIVSIYFPMIAQSAKILGSGPLANVPFFGIAFISSIAIAITMGNRLSDLGKMSQVPLWLWTSGIMSAGLIIGSSFLIPRLGLGAFFVLLVSGQVLASMIFGFFGVFGVPATDVSWGKLLGAALVIGGVYLVTFK